MSDRDIRNFFASNGSKSSTNKSNLVKQITLNPKKDIKKITKKEEKKPKKEKVKLTKEDKIQQKKDFSTPVKKAIPEIKKENIKKNKSKNKPNNKKIILDEDEESENPDVEMETEEAGKQKIEQNNKNDNYIDNYVPPPKKEEKLVPISVSDFFNTKKITVKTDVQIKQEQKMENDNIKNKNEIKNNDNDIKENKMEIEEEQKETKKEITKEKEKNKQINKVNNERENNNKDDNDNMIDDILEDIVMENSNENDKKADKPNLVQKNNKEQIKEFKINIKAPESKKNINNNINLNNKKESPKKEIIPKPIIRREIRREIKPPSNNLNQNQNRNNQNKYQKKEPTKSVNNVPIPISKLWLDKYYPQTMSDIIGNQPQIRNLEVWLDTWDDCILHGHKKEQIKTGKKFAKNENVNARAAIVSGPSGIGKTSSVRVLAKTKGYRIFELNASDKRNKDTINNSVGFLMNNTTLSSVDNSTNSKNIIIMDEIDGMSGNEDKGGIKALIDIAKKTKVPIIFICNDIYSPKLKSLINYCYDIRFNRPEKRQIVFRLIEICKKEKIFIDNQTLNYIVENFNCDIRQIINYLDLCSREKKNLSNLKSNCEDVKKDKSVTVGSFDICKILLNRSETSKLNFGQKLDLFFVDFDLIPSMIYENYILTAIVNNNSPNKAESLSKIIQGLDHMSVGDVIENRMKSQMDWSLLPDKGVHSTVIPSCIFSSFLSFPKFPESYNKISRMTKIGRELRELKKIFPNYSLFEIKSLVGPLFFNIVVDKLINEGKNGIDNIVDILTSYGMNANMFKENLLDLQSKENQNMYNKINNSIKTTLTKKLNEKFKTSVKQHKTRTIMMPQIKVDKDGNLLDDYDEDDVDEEEADDQSSSIFEPIKKTNKKKNK